MLGRKIKIRWTLRTYSVLAFSAVMIITISYLEFQSFQNLRELRLTYEKLEGRSLSVERRLTLLLLEQEQKLKKHFKMEGSSSAAEQVRRRMVMREVCDKYRLSSSVDSYTSKKELFHQMVNSGSFLLDDRSRTVYCFNHKAASSTWMALFASLHQDGEYVKELVSTGNYYKIISKMGAKSQLDLLQKVNSGDYFTFTVIRHPFDRILSAFRDRIMDGCTDQAKHHIPRIFEFLQLPNRSDIFDTTGCTRHFPTFSQFVKYIIFSPEAHDVHWTSYGSNCAPCVLDYDAVVKLETAAEDQEYVMRHSALEKYAQLEDKHRGGGGTETVREEYFSPLSCSLLQQLHEVYKMDFELFEYNLQPFSDYCIHVQPPLGMPSLVRKKKS